jgi:hypothetical protein
MSLPKPDLHVRISEEAKATLRLLADAYQQPECVLAGQLLERALMGEGHTLKIAARRLYHAGFAGSARDD